MLKLHFINLPDSFLAGLQRIAARLQFTVSEEGLPVYVKKGCEIRAAFADGKAEIMYMDKIHFFRAVGLLCEHLAEEAPFEIIEKPQFDVVSVMLDSTSSVLKVEAIQTYLDYMAIMGLNMAMLYTEDTYAIKSHPYFGYMRGAYSFEELKACDDYADAFGIEMIPCIQTYGHMGSYLKWEEATPVRDTQTVLLADEEETYTFIEEMIRTATAPFRSKRIHIGMDESKDMGRGAHLTKHGAFNPADLYLRHLQRVVQITDKYGLTPMMWSDMFFRVASESGNDYYHKDTVITKDIADRIPSNVQLVYWHYGEEPGADGYMLDKHLTIGRDVIFSGAVWCWSGHFPENYYTIEASEAALAECKKRNIREVMVTMWGAHDGTFEATYLGLQLFAEHMYHPSVSQALLKKRFEFCTGAKYDAYMDMSQYHNIFEDGREYFWNDRFVGKQLLWQDVLEGLSDDILFHQPMSAHYEKYAEKFREYAKDETDKFHDLYQFSVDTFACLAIKSFIGERLKPAYDAGDTAFLRKAVEEYLPTLLSRLDKMHAQNRKMYFKEKKAFLWAGHDLRYGTVKARTETAIIRIRAYLDGEITALEDLAAERLPIRGSAFRKYIDMALPVLTAK